MRRLTAAFGLLATALMVLGLLAVTPVGPVDTARPAAAAERVTRTVRIPMSDGITLRAAVSGASDLSQRPTIVEFTPYGHTGASYLPPAAYNQVVVEIRGTGDSDGRFDALGPRAQEDVVQALDWICSRPWSNGQLGLAGFSASAIMIYNSMHQELPCVRAMMLKSGTFELYRDLLVPGGVSNLVPGAGVVGLIGAPTLQMLPDRMQRDPATILDAFGGLFAAGVEGGFAHPELDAWWRQRGFRGDVNKVPVLMINGFFDVESRGAFQAFQALRESGAHLRMVGGHDGVPQGSDGGQRDTERWFDRYLRGIDNGIEREPRVQLMMSRGDREDYLAGDVARADGGTWPLPGTKWTSLFLNGRRSGTSMSINDGTLTPGKPAWARQSYPVLTSVATMTDTPNAALVGAGAAPLFDTLPWLTEATLSEPGSLTYTTSALTAPVRSAGPLNLRLKLATTTPGMPIWAVLSDVAPDGTAHPLTVGRLNTDHPGVVTSKSLVREGRIVQPYGDHSTRDPAAIGQSRDYQVELWPVGNVFEKGHRIRLHLVGQSFASKPALPALATLTLGEAQLLFPTLAGNDLAAALQ